MKILVAGDFCPNNRLDSAVKEERFGALFDEVKPIIDTADYSIVNFEFPIVLTSDRALPIPKNGPCLKGTVEAIKAIKYAGFNCCTLANNHILDQGEMCCIDTINALKEHGLDTVGAGEDIDTAKRILYKEKDGEVVAFINCTEHEFSIAKAASAGANPINPIQQYYQINEAKKKASTIIIIVHGGHEHCQLPSLRMQELYRFYIDAGADVVINGHQHCFSGYEIYKEKPIFYGLGNFCFDTISSPKTTWFEGYMVAIDTQKTENDLFELIPYIQCKDEVGVFFHKDKKAFYDKIELLNKIIAEPHKLADATNTYYHETESYYIDVHVPYNNKILRRLYRMKLLPSLLNEKRILKLINFIECESHRDRELAALYSRLSKYDEDNT